MDKTSGPTPQSMMVIIFFGLTQNIHTHRHTPESDSHPLLRAKQGGLWPWTTTVAALFSIQSSSLFSFFIQFSTLTPSSSFTSRLTQFYVLHFYLEARTRPSSKSFQVWYGPEITALLQGLFSLNLQLIRRKLPLFSTTGQKLLTKMLWNGSFIW